MGEKYNLIDLGNINEPVAGVVNNFIDKISNALEWLVTPKDIKPAIIEANKSIIEEISNRQDINLIERAAIVSNYKKIVKQYNNQVDIIKVAVEHLNFNINPIEVQNDWIKFFFDKVKDTTDAYMKEIWGRILAGEFNNPNTYTKQLIHILSIMDSKLAKRFQKIRSSCFYSAPCLYTFVYRTNGKEIKNVKKYQEMSLYISDFKELDSLGIIQYRYSDFHSLVIKNKTFEYGDKIIKLNTNNRSIAIGNVSLTNVGKQLCRIVPMEYDDKILEVCLESWGKLGYNPEILNK